MTKTKYPTQWADASSEGLVINYTQLTNLCVTNGLDSGNIAYIANQMRMACMGTIDQILASQQSETSS